MKILYVITRSDVMGGASMHLLDLVEGIKALGHEVLILVGGGGVFLDLAKQRNLQVRSLRHLVRDISLVKDVQALKEISKAISDFKPDIVHSHSSKAGVLGRVAARINGVPGVFTAHGWAFTDGVSARKKRFYKLVERLLARITDRIITVSNYDRELALRYRVGHPSLLVTIHNGVRDVSVVKPMRQIGENFKFIMVARFDEPKDHLLLLRALGSIRDKSWIVEFVGDGPELENCRQLALRLDLAERVVFSGFCDDVQHRIATSQVLVLASKWEGLPLTIIEAMRGGLPVVASNVGGIPELVIDGITGLLAERGSESAMASCLKAVIENPRRRAQMGASARLRYEQHFSFERMQNQTMAVYQSVVREVGV